MKKGLIALLAVVLVLFIIAGSFFGSYNKLQVLDESVNSQWAQIQNQLQRRSDLIPNLVNTVKGYAAHEKQIFVAVADARSRLAGAVKKGDVKGVNQANGEFNGALSRLLAIAENYPQLKANENFLQLQSQLEGTENRIAVERKKFNEAVQEYNTSTRTFPRVIVAKMFGFKEKEYFKAKEGSENAPDVKFDFNGKPEEKK